MKIYLAGSSQEIELCESYRDRLRATGHVVAHDWMTIMRAEAHRKDREIEAAERAAFARGDLDGVSLADVLWLLTPKASSIGAWVEFGYALGIGNVRQSNMPITIISGPWRSIFGDLADYSYPTHEDVFQGHFA